MRKRKYFLVFSILFLILMTSLVLSNDKTKAVNIDDSWEYIGGDWYYRDPKTKKRVIDEWKWLKIYDESKKELTYNWKYFNKDGKNIDVFYMEKGDTWLSQAGPYKGYYKGFWTDPKNGYKYYFRETSGSRVSGFQFIDDTWYYFRKNSGTLAYDWQCIDGKWYFFDNLTGENIRSDWAWTRVFDKDGKTYTYNYKYFDEKGLSQARILLDNGNVYYSQYGPYNDYYKGWKDIGDNRYFFRKTSGSRVKSRQYIDGKWEYFNEETGALGDKWQKEFDSWYYIDPNSKEKLRSQWKKLELNGKLGTGYKYFDESGKNIEKLINLDKNAYIAMVGPDSKYFEGWYKDGNSYYYFMKNKGNMVKGLQFIDGYYYYFDESGKRINSWKKIDGDFYYFDNETARMAISKWVWAPIYENGKILGYNWKYFDKEGKNIDLFYQENGKFWLSQKGPNSSYYKGWWEDSSNGCIYYFREDSASRVSGFQYIDGAWYYFRETSGSLCKSWQYINGSWYYFDEDGKKFFGLLRLDGRLYYLDEKTGILQDESQYINGVWYEIVKDKDGSLPHIKDSDTYTDEGLFVGYGQMSLKKVNSKYYYFDSKGNMIKLKGLHSINGQRYYFNSDSSICEGWVHLDHLKVIYTRKDGSVDEVKTARTECGVDLSQWNRIVDFDALKKAGVDFVILRAGYGRYESQKDPYFETNYKNRKKAGLKVGTYHYSYARDLDQAKKEAQVFLKFIEGKTFDYPVFIDMEEEGYGKQGSLSNSYLTDIANLITDEIRNAGYTPGIYANKNWFTNKFQMDRIKDDVVIWMAIWPYSHDYRLTYNIGRNVTIWQYTEKGRLAEHGDRDFDLNVSFISY